VEQAAARNITTRLLYFRTVTRYLIAVLCLGTLLLASCMMPNVKEQRSKNEKKLAAEGITALTPGDAAPAFSSTTHLGGDVTIPQVDAERRIVLFFYLADDTPNTTRQLQQLSKPMPVLEPEGIHIYGISKGSAREHQAYAEKYGITVPLIADKDLAISTSYGCALAGGSFVQRTMVGIDRDGTIAFFERGFPMGDPANEIMKWYGLVAEEE